MNLLHPLIYIFINLITVVLSMKDYYETLEVDRKATTKEIKQAYRKMALRFHPDKNPDVSPSVFMNIKDAYDVLSDENQRRSYDHIGHASYTNQGYGGGTHFKPGNFHFDFGSFEDLFKDMDDDVGFADFVGGNRHANNLGRGFLDLDEMFGDTLREGSHFGSQDSFFGHGHFYHQHAEHVKHHRQAHNQAHHQQFAQNQRENGGEGGGGGVGGRSCKTVTQKIGNSITTYTTCE